MTDQVPDERLQFLISHHKSKMTQSLYARVAKLEEQVEMLMKKLAEKEDGDSSK